MKLSFKVDHVNDGPAPFDVVATNADGVELRLRFPDGHPLTQAGETISVSYTDVAPPEPEPVDEE